MIQSNLYTSRNESRRAAAQLNGLGRALQEVVNNLPGIISIGDVGVCTAGDGLRVGASAYYADAPKIGKGRVDQGKVAGTIHGRKPCSLIRRIAVSPYPVTDDVIDHASIHVHELRVDPPATCCRDLKADAATVCVVGR